ncbi:hypothetical protein L596_010510 [Steinernema carpocapsae]|uniref:C-type lectin domain-containing protein n=1 Tax=Steinernema carpocapsae TaxID=34508 RepID=A0A4U5PIK1_STECR|nr:hypothetical protein L596_010510 [Steinernema carpocapsae]
MITMTFTRHLLFLLVLANLAVAQACPSPPSCPSEPCTYICPQGWTFSPSTKFCYTVDLPFDGFNFTVAENLCQLKGGHLASIHTDAENQFIIDLVQNQVGAGQIWTGLYVDPVTKVFKWTDGCLVDYAHWNKSTPICIGQSFKCTQIRVQINKGENFLWELVDCAKVIRPLVCKKAPQN